tara:strand:+ start:1122 stop:1805 length:684 start_codon:yes stop_codon:yes gene_type:complete
MNLAIIPARSGSKRIPNKNIKFFFGKPIMSYSIDLAIKSKIFDKVIVSTDSSKIKKIAERNGAEVPFIRPKYLSNDSIGADEVVRHAIRWYVSKGINLKNICCIYPTSPLLKKKYLVEGYKKLKSKKWNFVFSAGRYAGPVQRAFILKKNLGVKMLLPKYYEYNSQDLSDTFYDAGNFYWAKKNTWINKKNIIFSKSSTIVEIPSSHVEDVNTLSDWKNLTKKYQRI